MTLQSSYIFFKKECASKKDHVDSAGNKILVIEVGHRIHNYIMKLFPDASSEKITNELFKNKITYVMQVGDDFYHETLLFTPSWTPFDEETKKKFLDEHQDLSKLSDDQLRKAFSEFSIKSDWERFFSSKVGIDEIEEIIRLDMA